MAGAYRYCYVGTVGEGGFKNNRFFPIAAAGVRLTPGAVRVCGVRILALNNHLLIHAVEEPHQVPGTTSGLLGRLGTGTAKHTIHHLLPVPVTF